MAASYSTALRDARQNAITTAIGTAGKLVIKTASGGTTLVTFTWGAVDMFGASVTGVITMVSPAAPTVVGVAAGTATYAELQTSASVVVVSNLTVGTTATDVIITNTNIAVNDPITLTFASCTMTSGNI